MFREMLPPLLARINNLNVYIYRKYVNLDGENRSELTAMASLHKGRQSESVDVNIKVTQTYHKLGNHFRKHAENVFNLTRILKIKYSSFDFRGPSQSCDLFPDSILQFHSFCYCSFWQIFFVYLIMNLKTVQIHQSRLFHFYHSQFHK